MSKMAHSNQETMDEIEARSQDAPIDEPPSKSEFLDRYFYNAYNLGLDHACQLIELYLPGSAPITMKELVAKIRSRKYVEIKDE